MLRKNAKMGATAASFSLSQASKSSVGAAARIAGAFPSLLRFGLHANFLVVVIGALLFPGADLGAHTPIDMLKLYFSFNICLYGALYTINGISDAEEDASHPEKKFRPISKHVWAPGSSGSVSPTEAAILVAALFATAYTSSYTFFGTHMLPIFTMFIVLNLTYSFCMREVKYCRFWFAALTAPTRLHLGTLLTGGVAPLPVYFVAYFFMTAAQSSKVRIENASLKKSLNGWSAGTVEMATNAGLAVSLAAYSMTSDPLRFVFISIAAVAHTAYNVVPYFNKKAEKTLRTIYTLDCPNAEAAPHTAKCA